MKIKTNAGFTLIELLVVIAIVGILSAVVLSALNSARNKGNDASVKSNLSGMRSVAENLYDAATGTNGYNQVCANSSITAMQNAAVSAGGNGGVCANAVTYWVAWAGLKVNTAQAFCVDNTGAVRVITKPVGAITVCP